MPNTVALQQRSIVTASDRGFVPILLREIELGQPLPVLSAFDKPRKQTYQRIRCLIRLHTQPLGLVDFTLARDELLPDEYTPQIWHTLGVQINAHLYEDNLPSVTGLDATGLPALQTPKCVAKCEAFLQNAPFASVVISTRDRPVPLARCLSSLLAMRYPDYEVIVVDNAPSTSATADLIKRTYADEPRIRYVREDRPGLSSGRNRGILEARGDIIAITDDDVVVDTYWLAGLVMGFSITENVACVTGLILPQELETYAQFLFEAHDGSTKRFSRRIFDLQEHRWKKPSYPYLVGACTAGSGACMAFTARFLQGEGGFDPALGAGTPTHAAEETAIFFRVIMSGHRLVYEPASQLYHQHHREYTVLQKRAYNYGIGLTAYLTKIIIDHPLLIFDGINKFMHCLLSLVHVRSSISEEAAFTLPQELKRLERKGWLRGPIAYIQSRRACSWTRKGLTLIQASANTTSRKSVASSNQSQESLVNKRMSK